MPRLERSENPLACVGDCHLDAGSRIVLPSVHPLGGDDAPERISTVLDRVAKQLDDDVLQRVLSLVIFRKDQASDISRKGLDLICPVRAPQLCRATLFPGSLRINTGNDVVEPDGVSKPRGIARLPANAQRTPSTRARERRQRDERKHLTHFHLVQINFGPALARN